MVMPQFEVGRMVVVVSAMATAAAVMKKMHGGEPELSQIR